MSTYYEAQYEMYDDGARRYSEAKTTTGKPHLPTRPPQPGVNGPTPPTPLPARQSKKWIIPATVLAALCFIALAVNIVQNNINHVQISGAISQLSEKKERAVTEASCQELKNRGNTEDGIYAIKPVHDQYPVEVYCDMTTDGGGWTLVASVHENSIEKKCADDDLWSRYVPSVNVTTEVITNWENEIVFGNVRKCTEGDYKNAAYYSMKASNVMVWHVPEHSDITRLKQYATLRYRTTDNFLMKNGNNLKGLYELYPLALKPDVALAYEKRNINLLQDLKKQNIKSVVQNNANLQISTSTIRTGAFGTTSNTITFRGNRSCTFEGITYGKLYSCKETLTAIETNVEYPFLTVVTISNVGGLEKSFEIEMSAYTLDNVYKPLLRLSNNITKENYVLKYKGISTERPSSANAIHMCFVVSNNKDWSSIISPTAFEFRSEALSLKNKIRCTLKNTPKNVVMGTVLLVKKPSYNIEQEEMKSIAEKILDAVIRQKTLFKEQEIWPGFLSPTVFDDVTNVTSTTTVTNSTVLKSMIPAKMKHQVETGFLQFRAFDSHGYPSALCPGVRMISPKAKYACIGGVSDGIGIKGTCGDFAGWEGMLGDIPEKNKAVGFSHSQEDLRSVILLFQR